MENVDTNKSSSTALLEKVDSTLVAWLVFLIVGGGIISLYYARIHYLPDIEWSSSIVHLAVATFVGGAITILLALSLFIPGYIWSECLIFDERLLDAFCFHETSKELCLRTLLRYIGLPFWIVLLLNHAILFVLASFLQTGLLGFYMLVSAAVVALASLFIIRRKYFITLLVVARRRRRKRAKTSAQPVTPETDLDEKEANQRVFKYVAWFALSILLGQISMALIYLLSGRPTLWPFVLTTLACTICVLVSNHFVALHYRRSRVQAVAAALVAASLLVVVADRNESFSAQVMSFYGIGDLSQTVDLLLKAEGETMVEDLKVSGKCSAGTVKKICNVRVLSRLGNEYYLMDQNGQKFSLPKEVVLSRTPSQ